MLTQVVLLLVSSAACARSIDNVSGFKGIGTPPTVVSIFPANNATNVAPNSNVVITFDESVSLALDSASPLTDNSIIIDCSLSGVQSYPQIDTDGVVVADINFNDFINGDVCTVTVSAFWVHDEDDGNHFDGNGDGFANPVDDDYVSTFSVGMSPDLIFAHGFEN